MTCHDLYNHLEEESDEFDGIQVPANMRKKMLDKMRKKKATEKVPLKFKLLDGQGVISGDLPDQSEEILLPEEAKEIAIRLPIEITVIPNQQTTVSNLTRLFVTGIQQQVEQLVATISRSTSEDANKLCLAEPRSFWSKQIVAHCICAPFPSGVEDQDLVSHRKELHLRYLVPLDRPQFRSENRFNFPGEGVSGGYLTNTHLGLSSGLEGGIPSVVYGTYAYHHYMQDRMDDSGWGCAYRSLQTIVSWFRHQGYVTRAVPTHQEIQQALVDVGDKPATLSDRDFGLDLRS